MTAKKFIQIASALNVGIYAPSDGCISFFNSPFPAHRELKAVDITPAKAEFGGEVVCPVDGAIKAVEKYPSPNLYPDKPCLDEYLILVECTNNPRVYAKILHARPSVRVGDIVHIGDTIGTLSRSGYIPFWVDPHIHVELRSYKNPIRASGAYHLQISNPKQNKTHRSKPTRGANLAGTVTYVDARYAVIHLKGDVWKTVGNFSSLKVRVGSGVGILDGGIPHMGYGGVLYAKVKKSDSVFLEGIKIGEVTETTNSGAIFKIKNFKVMVNHNKFRGISSRLYLNNKREIKLIPIQMGCVNVDINDSIRIKINTNK